MSISGPVAASQASKHIMEQRQTVQNGGEGVRDNREGERDDGGGSDSDEENQGEGGNKGGWRTGWDSESDEYSESDLPPPGWNPDAELAQDLDLSKIYEPPSLKFTQTPFTLARSRPRKDTTTTSKHNNNTTSKASTSSTAPAVSQVPQTSTTGLSKSINIPRPPPAPKPKRRGPVPAKSGRMFEAPEPPPDKKKPFKKWTKAEANGWKDATGKPIPTTKTAAPKKAPTPPSITQILDQAPVKGKGGKGKGKGKTVVSKTIGDEVEELEVDEVAPKGKKKAAPKKKKGDDEVVKGTKQGKKDKSVRIIEDEAEEEEKPVAKSAAKAAEKRKVVESDDDQPGPSRKRKAGDERGRAKGRGRSAAREDNITFTRLPAGAATNTDYPIIDSLEKQRSLPTKKPAVERKTKTKPVQVDSPPLSETDKAAFAFFSSLKNPLPGNKLPLDRLIPPSTTAQKREAEEQDIEDGESVDSDVSYTGARVDIGGVGNEEEGKVALMSRYFSQQTTRGKSLTNSGPTLVPTPPADSSTLDPPTITKLTRSPTPNSPRLNQGDATTADSSSALPYSSPLEKRQVRRQDSQLVHPQPIRAAVPTLPNADRYERLKEIAKQKGIEAEAKGNSFTAPDLTSVTKKGYTMPQPFTSASRHPRRGKSPQSQIESRYRSQPKQATRPDFSHDNFRPPAWHKNHPQAKSDEDNVWSTLDSKPKKGYPSSFVERLVNGNSRSSTTGGSMYSASTTTSNMIKRPNLFTPTAPAPPPPEITVPIPKFRVKTSTNGGIPYGAQGSASQDKVDPYKRPAASTGYAVNGSSPEEETLYGKHGVYRVNKRAGTGGYEERPRYMPAMVVPLDRNGSKGWGDDLGEDRLEQWRNPQSKGRGTSASWQASNSHDSSEAHGHRVGEIVTRDQADYGDPYLLHSQPHRQVSYDGHDRYYDADSSQPVMNGGGFEMTLPAQSQPRSRLDIPMATFIGSGSSRSNQRSDDSANYQNGTHRTRQMGNGYRSASEVHYGGVGNGGMYGTIGQEW